MRVALLRDQLEEEIDKLRNLKLSADNLDNQNQEKGTCGVCVFVCVNQFAVISTDMAFNGIWVTCTSRSLSASLVDSIVFPMCNWWCCAIGMLDIPS